MNITQILSIIDYDTSKIIFFDEQDIGENMKAFTMTDFAGVGVMNKLTSEVVYLFAINDTDAVVWASDDYDISDTSKENTFISSQEMLELFYATYNKQPDKLVDINFTPEDLKFIDDNAAALDITRSAYITKCLLSIVEENNIL